MIKIVLCEPFMGADGPVYDPDKETWRTCMEAYQKEVKKIAEEFDAVFVPLQEVFDAAFQKRESSYWIWDGGTSNGERTRSDRKTVAEVYKRIVRRHRT